MSPVPNLFERRFRSDLTFRTSDVRIVLLDGLVEAKNVWRFGQDNRWCVVRGMHRHYSRDHRRLLQQHLVVVSQCTFERIDDLLILLLVIVLGESRRHAQTRQRSVHADDQRQIEHTLRDSDDCVSSMLMNQVVEEGRRDVVRWQTARLSRFLQDTGRA